ncbi:hypothetical protein [Enterobacter mori]
MSGNTCKTLKPELVQHIINSFTADFKTGQVFWKVNSKKKRAGDELPARTVVNGSNNLRKHKMVSFTFEGKTKHMKLSRVIFILYWKRDVKPGYLLDHANRDSMDDTMSPTENIRELTVSQNNLNSVSHRGSASRFKGVYFDKKGGYYYAQYRKTTNGVSKSHYLGKQDSEEAAARVYDRAVLQAHGTIAFTNFPATDYPDLISTVKQKSCPFKGVRKQGDKFISQFRHAGKRYYGGTHQTPTDAFAATQYMREELGLQPYPQPAQGV